MHGVYRKLIFYLTKVNGLTSFGAMKENTLLDILEELRAVAMLKLKQAEGYPKRSSSYHELIGQYTAYMDVIAMIDLMFEEAKK